MDVSYICFDEIEFNNENKFYLDYSSNSHVTNTILYSPEKDYFITSMFCPLNIKPDISKSAKNTKKLRNYQILGRS